MLIRSYKPLHVILEHYSVVVAGVSKVAEAMVVLFSQ